MRDRTKYKLTLAAGLTVAMSLGFHGLALAQVFDAGTTFNPNNTEAESFDRGENVSVLQRPRPDYQAQGIHLGGFLVYPKLTVSAAYDDNIFALQTGAVGDAIFTLAPELDVQSTWSRNALDAYIRASQDLYTKYTSEDATQYGAGVSGKLDFDDSNFTAGVDYGHYVLPRWVPDNGLLSQNPIQYDYTGLDAELVHTLNRLRLSVRADYQIYEYQNGETSDGLVVIEDDQNRAVATFTAKAEYAVSPDAALFITTAYNSRDYQLNPPAVPYTRNSTGYDIAVGANFDLTHLIRGEFQLGYLDQQYVSPLFRPIEGVSAKAQIEWFPTQLTTVTLTALRTVGDSGIIDTAGYVATVGGVKVDHELLRNLILSANATDEEDQYVGIDRTDYHWGVRGSATWLLNRRVGLTFGYTFTDWRSEGADKGQSFLDNLASVSTVLQF